MSTTRRADVDNLRSAATYLLLVFHTAKVYDYSPFYHLKNSASFQGFDVFTGFVHQWHMPLFFVLAGWSMAAALLRRGGAEIRAERRQRLLIPLVVWSLVACPWIAWIELSHIHHVHHTFWHFLPSFFGPRFTWSQLWFLAYLFAFSLLYLKRFERLSKGPDRQFSDHDLRRFVLVMIGIQVGLRWAWPGFQNLVWDWANFAYYSMFFIAGFYWGRFPAVAELVDRRRRTMGWIGLVAAAALVPFWLRLVVVEDFSDWPGYLAYNVLSALAGVGLVIAILGWARRHFAGEGRLHRWTRANAYGVYLLHQICVVAAATIVVRTAWPIAVKFTVTLVAATAATVALNEVLGRWKWLAPAFGETASSSTLGKLSRWRRRVPGRTPRPTAVP